MIGAEDVAFPRINLLSVVPLCYRGVVGGYFAVYRTGTSRYRMDILCSLQLQDGREHASGSFRRFCAGVLFHPYRAEFPCYDAQDEGSGNDLDENAALSLDTLCHGWIQLLATPIIGITLLMIVAERTLHIGFFDPTLGGDPLLYQHLFWTYSHPAVYIMILPAMGAISEIIATFSHKTIFGYKFMVVSALLIAFVGYFVWGHHMFTSGMSGTALYTFSLLTFLVAIPSAIKVFNWIATMHKGSIDL